MQVLLMLTAGIGLAGLTGTTALAILLLMLNQQGISVFNQSNQAHVKRNRVYPKGSLPS